MRTASSRSFVKATKHRPHQSSTIVISDFPLNYHQGWPERFLNKYKDMDPTLHDRSMDKVELGAMVSFAGPNDDMLSLHRLCKRMELSSYSTSFSGIDSPGCAFGQLRYAASHITGVEINHPPHHYGIVSRLP